MHGICDTHRLAVRPLDDEFVLEHHEVALAGGVRHERLELRAERVEQVALTRRDLGRGEEPDPAQAGHDASGLALVGELADLPDLRDEGPAKRQRQIVELR